MSEDNSPVATRRKFLGVSGAALAAAAMAPLVQAQQDKHDKPNEEQPGRKQHRAR